MDEIILTLIPIFFIISVIYSAAGFGGGSSYLAILALFPLAFTTIRMVALLCNIVVVTGSVFIFYKNGFFKIRKILPLVLWSVPFAYLGGSLQISQHVFFIILGFTLFVAAVLMLISKTKKVVAFPNYTNAIIGSSIGFLSGLVGIGGGIFLSPLLYLSRWSTPKIIATTTACFIFANSIAGFVGQVHTNGFHMNTKSTAILLLTVLIGGQIGSRISATKINPLLIKKITAFLILLVAIRILWKHLPLSS